MRPTRPIRRAEQTTSRQLTQPRRQCRPTCGTYALSSATLLNRLSQRTNIGILMHSLLDLRGL